jgi:hypothetical protein
LKCLPQAKEEEQEVYICLNITSKSTSGTDVAVGPYGEDIR